MRGWGAGVGVGVAVVVLTSCGLPRPSARERCERAHPREEIVAAYATTVHAIRTWSVGDAAPAADAWPGIPAEAPAFWCYHGASGTFLEATAITPGREPYAVVSGIFRPTPNGPHVVPNP